MRIGRPRTLRGRLALWYAGVMAVVLGAFCVTAFIVDEVTEAPVQDEPGERNLMIAFAIGLPAAIGVAVVGGLSISRKALRPLDDLVRITRELDARELSTRVPLTPGAPEELARLTEALNSMLARLEASVAGLGRFTADASHELRTPLAALMGQIEVALRKPREPAELRATLEESLEELGRLSQLVDSLLTLARSDAGEIPLEVRPVPLGEVVDQAVSPYEDI